MTSIIAGIPLVITSSKIGLKICVIAAGITKYKLIIKKKKKEHGRILSLAKSKLNSVEVLIVKALTDPNFNHGEFVWINDMPNEFDEMKEEIKNYIINKSLNYICKSNVICLKCRKNTESKNPKVVKTKNGRRMLLSKCAVCNSKKYKFIKEQQARGLSGNLTGIKVPILSDLSITNNFFKVIKWMQ